MSTFQIQAKDAIYSINDIGFGVNAMQNFSWDPAFNEEFTEELGNEGYTSISIEPELSGSFDLLATGSTATLLSMMIQTRDGSGGFTGYDYDAAIPTNAKTWTSPDLEYAVFDMVGFKAENEVFTRAEYFPRLFLSSIALSADASGNAQETYSFEGQFMDVYRGDYRDVVPKPATYTTDTTVTLVDSAFRCDTSTPTNGTSPTHTIIGLLVNEIFHDDAVVSDVSDGAGVGPAVITVTGITIPVGARVMVLCYANTAGTTIPTSLTTPPTSAFYVRANQIDLFIVDTATVDIYPLADGSFIGNANFTDSNTFLRVQSFDMNIDLARESLRQIKKTDNLSSIYYRATTFPLNITASASTYESDLADWIAIQGVTDPPTNPDHKLNLGQFDGKEFQLVAQYYYNGTPVQAMALCDARVTGMSMSVGVGGRSEVNWSFSGSKFKVEGDDV